MIAAVRGEVLEIGLDHAVVDVGHPVVELTKIYEYGEIQVNSGGTLEVGFEASIADQKIGRHVAELALVSSPSRSGSLTLADGSTCTLVLDAPGRHMALNGTAALAAGVELGVDADAMVAGLASFTGVRRRFEYKGRARGVLVYDDYAHHPTEVAAQLRRPAFSRVADLGMRYLPYGELERHREAIARFGSGMKGLHAISRTLA